MEENSTNYFFRSFFTILIAIGIFFVLKEKLPKRLFKDNVGHTAGIMIDSLALAAMADSTSLNMIADTIGNNEVPIRDTNSIDTTGYSGGYANLEYFYSKLYQLESTKQGKVRIAYFSDSMTDGDMIVQDIRSAYQKEFGGKGVGFVGITSLSAASRGSVAHQYSKNWINQSFLSAKKPSRSFGVDGQVAFVPFGEPAWIKYQASNTENSTALYNPTLFYGSSSNVKASLSVQINKDSVIQDELNPQSLLNTYSINASPSTLKIDFRQADSIPFYGINFDNGKGVHVDNFSIRGNSGLPLSLFNKDLMNAFDRVLNYDLIVLHYGANVLSYGTTDYTWYQNKMAEVVNYLRTCFPNANVLVISTADKSIKTDIGMETSPAVEPLLKAQAKYARTTHSGFVDLYSLMGGNGSMVKWVDEKSPLANKDYTHFSVRGAHKIGSLIYQDIQKGYLEYKKFKSEGKGD